MLMRMMKCIHCEEDVHVDEKSQMYEHQYMAPDPLTDEPKCVPCPGGGLVYPVPTGTGAFLEAVGLMPPKIQDQGLQLEVRGPNKNGDAFPLLDNGYVVTAYQHHIDSPNTVIVEDAVVQFDPVVPVGLAGEVLHTFHCRWSVTTPEQCEYRQTHHYCPHPEHSCDCRPRQAPRSTPYEHEETAQPLSTISNEIRAIRSPADEDLGQRIYARLENLKGLIDRTAQFARHASVVCHRERGCRCGLTELIEAIKRETGLEVTLFP